jgi:hypothetical protein
MKPSLYYCWKCGMGFRLRKLSPNRREVARNLRKHAEYCSGAKQ